KICNFVKDCDNGLDEQNCGQCDFQNSLCGWKNEKEIDAKWEWVSDSDTHLVSIDDDYDYGWGWWDYNLPENKYIILDNKGHSTASSATFRSPVLGATSPACQIQFVYHHNSKEGYLRI